MNNSSQTAPTLWCFRRWSRKPWGAFSGMCRLKIGVLSVAMSIVLLATSVAEARAQSADSTALHPLQISAVSVSARQNGEAKTQTINGVSQSRFVVDRKDSAPLAGVEAALRLVPAVDIRERGGRSSQADIAIRGGSFDQTMVMLGGVDFSDARTGHQSHSLPIDLDVVQDIAVLDGTAQAGALAGALDFRVGPSYPSNYLRARLEGGAWGYGYGNLSGGWQAGQFSGLGAVSYKRSDGYRYNTDFWNVNAYTQVRWNSPKAGRFELQAGFQRREWGSNGFYGLKFADQFESTRTALGSLRWNKTFRRLTVSATGSYRRNDDRFELFRGNAEKVPFNYHTTHSAGGEIYGAMNWRAWGITSAGANVSWCRMLSTAMKIDPLPNPSHPVWGNGTGNYPKGKSRSVQSVWLSHSKNWKRAWAHVIGTGVHSPYGIVGTYGAEGGWVVSPIFALNASVLRSMRLPTFTELYYNVGGYHPDPLLKPETAMNYRLVGRLDSGPWSGEVSLWHRRTSNVIDWEQRTGERPGDVAGNWYSIQAARLNAYGAEISARYTASRWSAMLSYGLVENRMSVDDNYISKYALDFMRNKLSAVAGVDLGWGVNVTLTGSYYDRAGSWIGTDAIVSGYKPYFLLDGRVSWSRRALQIYVDGTNLLGTKYFDFGGLTMPGTWLSAGIVVTLK